MKYFILALFNPRVWYRLYPTSKYWDIRLNYMLDCNPIIKIIDDYSIEVNGTRICTDDINYGARFDRWYKAWPNDKILPKRRTCIRLKEVIEDYKKYTLAFAQQE